MNQTQALAKLKKVVGVKLGYRVDEKALVGEARVEARKQFDFAKIEAEAAEASRQSRLEFVLANDVEYQALKAHAARSAKRKEAASANLYRRRITVGRNGSIFFSVLAQGDNWDEVVAIVSPSQVKA